MFDSRGRHIPDKKGARNSRLAEARGLQSEGKHLRSQSRKRSHNDPNPAIAASCGSPEVTGRHQAAETVCVMMVEVSRRST